MNKKLDAIMENFVAQSLGLMEEHVNQSLREVYDSGLGDRTPEESRGYLNAVLDTTKFMRQFVRAYGEIMNENMKEQQ